MADKFSRGNPHPTDSNLVFYKYRGEKERWVKMRWLQEQKTRDNANCRKHYRQNKEYYKSKASFRRAKIKHNIKLNEEDKKKTENFFCPQNFHVDHIFPIQHPHFCGLHAHWNLQLLTPQRNLSKSNKIETRFFEILGSETLNYEISNSNMVRSVQNP
jgi:hypothetical protein